MTRKALRVVGHQPKLEGQQKRRNREIGYCREKYEETSPDSHREALDFDSGEQEDNPRSTRSGIISLLAWLIPILRSAGHSPEVFQHLRGLFLPSKTAFKIPSSGPSIEICNY
jgi:hypothetical protein